MGIEYVDEYHKEMSHYLAENCEDGVIECTHCEGGAGLIGGKLDEQF